MISVLFWGFLAGIAGGFVGYVVFDWGHERWVQRLYRKRACAVDTEGRLHIMRSHVLPYPHRPVDRRWRP